MNVRHDRAREAGNRMLYFTVPSLITSKVAVPVAVDKTGVGRSFAPVSELAANRSLGAACPFEVS